MPKGRGQRKRRSDGTNVNESDDDTVMHGNDSAATTSHRYCSFMLLRTEVVASKKGTETMREQFSTIMSTLREADDSLAFSPYKSEIEQGSDGGVISSQANLLVNPAALPSSITALGRFLFGARPRSEGGAVWAQVRIVHNEPIDNIILDTKEDLKLKKSYLSLQSIQHWDVHQLGFLKNLHPDVDVVALTEFLETFIRIKSKQDATPLGLKVKTPYDGKKKDTKTTNFRDRIQAVHIDCLNSQKDIITTHLKAVLRSAGFKRRYAVDVRLVPLLNRNDSPYTQDKVRKCIVQHGQFCKCVDTMICVGIDHLDQRNAALKKTLRELIVGLPDAHFLNIDLNWRRDAFVILFPKKYEAIARDRVANLGAYLHRHYGDAILTSLPADTQEIVANTEWDDETGRPISLLDKELDDIITHGDTIEFIDLSLLEDKTDRPQVQQPTNTFVPHLDNTSVSTFGTAAPSPANVISPLKPSASHDDTRSTVSAMTMETMDSRMSKMETGFATMQVLLQKLVEQGGRSAQPSTSMATAGSNADPAAGA